MDIRPVSAPEECRQVAALEREVWAYPDPEEVPARMLAASVRRGAILLGAFDADRRLTGFAYSVPGIRNRQVTHWSHALAVLPAHRRRGLARRLKLAQRGSALELGIELIEWTFDPLQVVNAHFNFARLGTVGTEYEESAYDECTSDLHRGAPTDRLLLEWHLTRPHVERRLSRTGEPVVRAASLAGAVLVNPPGRPNGSRWPGPAELSADARRVLVEVPGGFSGMLLSDLPLARAWRWHTREVLQAYLTRGYRAVDFFLSPDAARGQYLLARGET